MKKNISSQRMLIFAGVILAIFVAVMLFTSFITSNISKKAKKVETTTEQVLPTPIPKEPSVYLDLPENFPKDIPLPAKAKVTLAKEENKQTTVVLLTALTADDVHDFYSNQLPSYGWQITSQSQGGGLTLLYIEKETGGLPAGRQGIITIGKSDLGTTISLTLSM